MKKIFAVVLALLLCFTSFAQEDQTIQEEFSLEDFSTEELILMKCLIQNELYKRKPRIEVTVPIGVYIVGEDIPEGKYKLRASSYSHVRVYENSDSKYSDFSEGLDSGEIIGKLELVDGNVVEISSSAIKFYIYEGLDF